jgi:hypothetical protein
MRLIGDCDPLLFAKRFEACRHDPTLRTGQSGQYENQRYAKDGAQEHAERQQARAPPPFKCTTIRYRDPVVRLFSHQLLRILILAILSLAKGC